MEASECIAYSLWIMDDVVVSWLEQARELYDMFVCGGKLQVGRSFESYIKEIGGLVNKGLGE